MAARLRRRDFGRPRRSRRLRRRHISRGPSARRGPGSPQCRIEVLIPDFKGEEAPLRTVLDARPDVLNHNIETVPRLYRTARPGGRYDRALQLLDRARTYAPDIPTKSGLMVGLGEEWDEVVQTLRDLSAVGCRIVTIGQYLRPSLANLPMSRYYTPAEFAELKRIGLELGIGHVESGPAGPQLVPRARADRGAANRGWRIGRSGDSTASRKPRNASNAPAQATASISGCVDARRDPAITCSGTSVRAARNRRPAHRYDDGRRARHHGRRGGFGSAPARMTSRRTPAGG